MLLTSSIAQFIFRESVGCRVARNKDLNGAAYCFADIGENVGRNETNQRDVLDFQRVPENNSYWHDRLWNICSYVLGHPGNYLLIVTKASGSGERYVTDGYPRGGGSTFCETSKLPPDAKQLSAICLSK